MSASALGRGGAAVVLVAGCLAGGACAGGGSPAPAPTANPRTAPPSPQTPPKAAAASPGRPTGPAAAPRPGQQRRQLPAAGEAYQVAARELSDYLLQSTIGIATISVGIGADDQEATPETYDNDGDRFTLSGRILLHTSRPIGVFRVGTDPIVHRSRAIVRRYPVLERKGMFIKVALDPSGRRTAWMRRTPESSFPDSVAYVDFNDAGSFRCYQLDLFYLAGGAARKLFEKPDKAASFTTISATPGAADYLGADFVPLQRKGNFLEIAALRGLDDPRTGIGWVEIKDPKSRLSVWFTPGPDC